MQLADILLTWTKWGTVLSIRDLKKIINIKGLVLERAISIVVAVVVAAAVSAHNFIRIPRHTIIIPWILLLLHNQYRIRYLCLQLRSHTLTQIFFFRVLCILNTTINKAHIVSNLFLKLLLFKEIRWWRCWRFRVSWHCYWLERVLFGKNFR